MPPGLAVLAGGPSGGGAGVDSAGFAVLFLQEGADGVAAPDAPRSESLADASVAGVEAVWASLVPVPSIGSAAGAVTFVPDRSVGVVREGGTEAEAEAASGPGPDATGAGIPLPGTLRKDGSAPELRRGIAVGARPVDAGRPAGEQTPGPLDQPDIGQVSPEETRRGGGPPVGKAGENGGVETVVLRPDARLGETEPGIGPGPVKAQRDRDPEMLQSIGQPDPDDARRIETAGRQPGAVGMVGAGGTGDAAFLVTFAEVAEMQGAAPTLPPAPAPAPATGRAGPESPASEPVDATVLRAPEVALAASGREADPAQDEGPATGPDDKASLSAVPDVPGFQPVKTGAERLWLGRLQWENVPTLETGTGRREDRAPTGPMAEPAIPALRRAVGGAAAAGAVAAVAGGAASLAPEPISVASGLSDLQEQPPAPDGLAVLSGWTPAGPSPGPGGSAALPGPPVGAQLAAQITASLARHPDGTAEIALSPDELGKVRLRLQPDPRDQDRMVVHLAFDRPETMELFRRHADQLAEAIRSAGYAEARLDFGQQNAGPDAGAGQGLAGQGGDGPDQPMTGDADRTASVPKPDRPNPLRPADTVGLNLRL